MQYRRFRKTKIQPKLFEEIWAIIKETGRLIKESAAAGCLCQSLFSDLRRAGAGYSINRR
ncbi:MAG: hypothetical protein LBK66_13325 [Spirochaetaceae bacterium]|jgi:hypothetical protein|nr:hypothetical protein [Spirochaetaceae bacterium]